MAGRMLVCWAIMAGHTMKDVARVLGVTARVVSRWKHDQCTPTLKNALLIAKLTAGEVPVSAWKVPEWDALLANGEPANDRAVPASDATAA